MNVECQDAPGGGDASGIYRHFAWRHPAATIIIEGKGTLPRCMECGMFTKTPDQHPNTETCRKLQKRRENERL